MARAPRPAYPCAVYHVTARGNNRAAIFTDDRDRDSLLALFAEAVKRFNLEIFAFCLMTNHFHLFLRTPEANISR
ncbi:MAG TPA: transposase, partial [bacterium]|nr:transposase [bacterium]